MAEHVSLAYRLAVAVVVPPPTPAASRLRNHGGLFSFQRLNHLAHVDGMAKVVQLADEFMGASCDVILKLVQTVDGSGIVADVIRS